MPDTPQTDPGKKAMEVIASLAGWTTTADLLSEVGPLIRAAEDEGARPCREALGRTQPPERDPAVQAWIDRRPYREEPRDA